MGGGGDVGGGGWGTGRSGSVLRLFSTSSQSRCGPSRVSDRSPIGRRSNRPAKVSIRAMTPGAIMLPANRRSWIPESANLLTAGEETACSGSSSPGTIPGHSGEDAPAVHRIAGHEREHLLALHPIPDRDVVADGRHPVRRASSPIRCFPSRRCRRSIFRPSRSRRRCRAAARKPWRPRWRSRWSASSRKFPALRR